MAETVSPPDADAAQCVDVQMVRASMGHVQSRLASLGNLEQPQPVGISWSDLSFSVPLADKSTKVIIDRASGYCVPGSLLAIMGSSGAGKTTLLNCLARRVPRKGTTSGKVLYNGQEWGACERAMRTLAAYITQDDLVMQTQTVREILMFSARMRLGKGTSSSDKKKVVDEVLRQLRLEKASDTIVGDPERGGISGGERKRVNIGVELVTNPSLLFVDEPTSGLDSSTARTVIETTKELAADGRSVLVTIHQPSSEVFFMFKRLLLLHKGRTVFFDETNNVVPYFTSLDYVCPPHHNPAEFIMAVLLDSSTGNDSAGTDFIVKWDEHVTEDNISLEMPPEELAVLEPPRAKAGGRLGFLGEVFVVFLRACSNFVREKMLFQARIAQTIFFAILCGLLFFNLTSNQQGVQDRLGLLFFVSINQLMLPMLGSVLTFPMEKDIFKREHRSGFYSVWSYFTAKSIAEIPFQIVFPFVFTCIFYYMAGLRSAAQYFFLCALTLMYVPSVRGSFWLDASLLACPSPS